MIKIYIIIFIWITTFFFFDFADVRFVDVAVCACDADVVNCACDDDIAVRAGVTDVAVRAGVADVVNPI